MKSLRESQFPRRYQFCLSGLMGGLRVTYGKVGCVGAEGSAQ